MKQVILKEIPLVLILLVPILYLASSWSTMPDIVPLHWNLQGIADRYGSKEKLMWVILCVPLLTYFILTIVPFLDTKNKIAAMGNKFTQLKYFLVTMMSLLSIYIIYTTTNENHNTFNFIVSFTALFFIIIGNYFKTIRSNYIFGVRTPWTLKNETVWKKTHEMTSILWIVLGLLLLLILLTVDNQIKYSLFFSVLVVASLFPIIYSYITYKNITNG